MPYNQKKQAGRGPKMKTGAGVPSALLQTDPKDEKSGEDAHPGYKKPVYKQPFANENLTSEQSFANYDSKRGFDESSKLDSIREVKMKGKWPKPGERINTNTSRTSPGNYSKIKSINPETGDYTIYKPGKSLNEKVVSRRDVKRIIGRQASWKKS